MHDTEWMCVRFMLNSIIVACLTISKKKGIFGPICVIESRDKHLMAKEKVKLGQIYFIFSLVGICFFFFFVSNDHNIFSNAVRTR